MLLPPYLRWHGNSLYDRTTYRKTEMQLVMKWQRECSLFSLWNAVQYTSLKHHTYLVAVLLPPSENGMVICYMTEQHIGNRKYNWLWNGSMNVIFVMKCGTVHLFKTSYLLSCGVITLTENGMVICYMTEQHIATRKCNWLWNGSEWMLFSL